MDTTGKDHQRVYKVVPIGRGGNGRGRGFQIQFSSPSNTKDLEIKSLVTETAGLSVVDTVDDVGGSLNADTHVTTSVGVKTPHVGNQGERCICLGNFFRLKKAIDVSVFEYNVAFQPLLESNSVKRRLLLQLQEIIGPVNNFNGHVLFLPKKLTNNITKKECDHPSSPLVKVEVTLKFVQEKTFHDLSPFYTILFQKILLQLGYIEVRRGFYKECEILDVVNRKLQVWPGIALSVEVEDSGELMVMVDNPSRIVRTDSLHDHYEALLNVCADDPTGLKEKFTKFVVGKIIICGYSQQCYKIDDVDYHLNPMSEFCYKHKMISYKEYFKVKYGVTIQNIHQPLLISRVRPRIKSKSSQFNPDGDCVRSVSLIPELCYLTGRGDQRSSALTKEICNVIRLNPALAVQKMKLLIQEILDTDQAQEILRDWGLTIATDIISLPARIIEPPHLIFSKTGEQKYVQPEPSFNKISSRNCYEAVDINKFLVLCTKPDSQRGKELLNHYSQACITVGIRKRTLGEIVRVEGTSPSHFIEALEKSCKPSEIQFVMIILPSRRDDVYKAVKKFCLTTVPTPSQCILSRTLTSRFVGNIALKICMQVNCKIGGASWGLRVPKNNVMILGMDAAHDPNFKNPSVIALIATLNNQCTKHFSVCQALPIHQEVNTYMRTMFIGALKAYKEHNAGQLPDHIIFFRDGGSAETFAVLKRYEVDICLEVLQEEGKELDKIPDFSYVCVAKRIPQRIFLRSEGNDLLNPLPGTVVDHTITQPSLFDFYVVSQQVNQGTLCPTHYTVLYETTPTQPDQVQKIAYGLTFMYFNWSGTIRVPSVIQYAHKLGQLASRVQCIPSRVLDCQLYFL